MKNPFLVSVLSVTCPTQGGTVPAKTVPSKAGRLISKMQAHTFARIPASVLFDDELTHEDIRVYGALSYKESGGASTTGMRLVADFFCIGKNRVNRSIKRLIEHGHLEQTIAKNGDRAHYKLLSPVFLRTSPISPVLSEGLIESPKKLKVSLGKCLKCFKQRMVRMTGWCKKCEAEKESERKVRIFAREEIAKDKIA